jgi:hypothetical protein
MDFLKKHYEKIILSVVLLGLVGFLAFLPVLIDNDKQQIANLTTTILPQARPMADLDLTRQQNILQRLQSPFNYDFSAPNKLFNPIEWKRDPNGAMIKIKDDSVIGAKAAVVTKITPLNLVVTLDAVQTNEMGAIYIIGVSNGAAMNPMLRRKRQHYITPGEKNEVFSLGKDGVKGDPANPDELVLKLADTGEPAVVSKDKPFQRLDAYSADLKYDPEGRNFPGRRAGQTILFNGDGYNIVAITADTVILSAQSNQKNTTLRYPP